MKYQGSRNLWLVVASTAVCAPTWAQEPPAAPEKPAQTAPAPPKPGNGIQWQLGETTVKLGGYVKLDLIHDFDRIGSTNSFDPRTIPTNGLDGVNTQMQANQTRLNLDVRGPTSTDALRFFVEGDFEGTGNAFRLRHAYGVMGPVLGGQTWSNFMDEDGMPETLDFESPIGFPQIRQAQARYTPGCRAAYPRKRMQRQNAKDRTSAATRIRSRSRIPHPTSRASTPPPVASRRRRQT